ncbi:MAG: di-trans,poly-cis-decaprenylcistransferase [Candidatus Methanomethylophilaceae archaeon]|nr:di-trans,poly-cis-decaprenylcistransferase [Candidatus Methanomethylophilaceae archaeon]
MQVPKVVTDQAYEMYQSHIRKEVLAEGGIPNHLAIIMDGNRRYAREIMGAEPMEGHRLGKEKLDEVVHWCLDLNIKVLTVFAFSTENFNREAGEVDYLMELLARSMREFAEDEDVHSKHVAIRVIGDPEMLPPEVQEAMEYAYSRTKDYDDFHLNLAIAYGGRQDIANAMKKVAKDVLEGKLDIDDIDESVISRNISTFGLPDPDLVLRTSGEIRISNFLLWQMAYSELYFTDIYWPGFRYIDLLRAIRTYQQRKRRFGR